MPIYEYVCSSCKKEFEIIQKFSDEPLTVCPDCSGMVSKKVSLGGFSLKGSGWYKTDYASKSESSSKNSSSCSGCCGGNCGQV